MGAAQLDKLPEGWGSDPKGDTAFGYVIRERIGTDEDFTWHEADTGIWTVAPRAYGPEPTWEEVCRLTDEWNDEHGTRVRSMSSYPVRLIDGEWSRTLMRVWHPY